MKSYKTRKELEQAPERVQEHVNKIIGDFDEGVQLSNIPEEALFECLLGGFIYELEEVNDLDQVETFKPSEDGSRWKTIRETYDVFDAIDVILGYTVIFNVTNNSGGSMYFIPDWMKLHCSYIQKSIELTNANN
jgi:hypothetical protein